MMKKLIVIVCFVGLCLSGCIKSLHSIIGEGDRILDERLEGIWTEQNRRAVITKISIESDDPSENVDSLKSELEGFFNATVGNQDNLWEISRAANLEWVLKNESSKKSNSFVKVSLDGVSENFDLNAGKDPADDEYRLDKKELLDFYIMTLGDNASNEEKDSKIVQLTQIGSNYFLDISEQSVEHETEVFDFLYPNISGHTIVKIDFDTEHINLYQFDADYVESLLKEKRIRLKHEMVNDEVVLTASTDQLRAFLSKYGDDERLFNEAEVFYTQKVG